MYFAKAPSFRKCKVILRDCGSESFIYKCVFSTREYTLAVLLHLTVHLLRDEPPQNRDSTLGGTLAGPVVKVRVHIGAVSLHSDMYSNLVTSSVVL